MTLVVTIIVVGTALLAERRMNLKALLFMVWGLAPMLFAVVYSYRRNAMWGAIFSLGVVLLLSHRGKRAKLFRIFG